MFLDNDYSIRVYHSFVAIMLALCLMLSVTYYAQTYAGIIGWSLVTPYIAEESHSAFNASKW